MEMMIHTINRDSLPFQPILSFPSCNDTQPVSQNLLKLEGKKASDCPQPYDGNCLDWFMISHDPIPFLLHFNALLKGQ